MDAAIRTDQTFCTTCGWVLPAGIRATCAACGGDATALPLADNNRPFLRDDDEDPSLTNAKEAWASGDIPRAIGLSLLLANAPRAFATPHGQGWVTAVGNTPVFAFFDPVAGQLSMEIPVVRLPQTKRVAALRAALVMCNEGKTAARLCLRLDLIVARFSESVSALSPAFIRKTAREIAGFARRAEEQLTLLFDARPAVPAEGVHAQLDRLGRPLVLPLLAPHSTVAPPSSHPSTMPQSSRPSSMPQSSRPSSIPQSSRPSSIRPTGNLTPPKAITLRLSIPPVLAAEPDDDDMPAVLSPDFASDSAASSSTFPPPSRPMEDHPLPPPPPRPSMLPSALPNVPQLGYRPPFASPMPMRTPQPSDADSAPASRRPPPPRPLPDPNTAEAKLCDLLRQALAFATALSFEERPYTMLLLVRAAVFRAMHEHQLSVPNAVAYLYRATRGVTREIWSSKHDLGRAGSVPVAEPALGALEQILAARAVVPKEKAATVEQWTSAQQAKENLGRYLSEIELSPQDPALRHYLALGALSELLSRTRLPATTDQRLRDIVLYAQRDGAKPHVIELMMTALRKIVAG